MLHPLLGALAPLNPDARVAAIEAQFDGLEQARSRQLGMNHIHLISGAVLRPPALQPGMNYITSHLVSCCDRLHCSCICVPGLSCVPTVTVPKIAA